MYTFDEDVSIRVAFQNIFNKEKGAKCSLDYAKASKEEIFAYMDEILPEWDKQRVHLSDIKKLLQWYDILIENEVTDFEEWRTARFFRKVRFDTLSVFTPLFVTKCIWEQSLLFARNEPYCFQADGSK